RTASRPSSARRTWPDRWGRRKVRDWGSKSVRRQAQELGAGIRGADVATAVVAATVGLEALGVRDRAWLKSDVVARFWRLILPRVASPETATALHAVGCPPVAYEPTV
ncbi:hypothetical protein PV733_46670, partial [Streptomyces europaeiscabiei]|nr:hypothetical protein [Streptomyces europaeiscabiei]